MEDKEVVCKECGYSFVITAKEQEWYKEKGFTEPKRCKDCRRLRRQKVIGKEN